MRYGRTRCSSDHDMFDFVHFHSRQFMNNLVFLVPHVASIFSLVLISYEEWITKICIGGRNCIRDFYAKNWSLTDKLNNCPLIGKLNTRFPFIGNISWKLVYIHGPYGPYGPFRPLELRFSTKYLSVKIFNNFFESHKNQ